MAKNRKNQAASVRFGPVLKVVLLGSLICGAAVGYVWQKSEIYRLGQLTRKREQTYNQLLVENQKLRQQVAYLHSPVPLEQRARELKLGLMPAQPSQKVRLDEPVPSALVNNAARQFTQRSMTGLTP